MKLLKRILKYLAITVGVLIALGALLYLEESTSVVILTNESPHELTNVEIAMVGSFDRKVIGTGTLKPGDSKYVFGNHADSEGNFSVSFMINGEKGVVEFGYFSGPIGDSHKISVQTKDRFTTKWIPSLLSAVF